MAQEKVTSTYEVSEALSRSVVVASKDDALSYAIRRIRQHIAEKLADEYNSGPPVIWIEPGDDYLMIRAVVPVLTDTPMTDANLSLDDWLEKQRRRIVAADGWIPKW